MPINSGLTRYMRFISRPLGGALPEDAGIDPLTFDHRSGTMILDEDTGALYLDANVSGTVGWTTVATGTGGGAGAGTWPKYVVSEQSEPEAQYETVQDAYDAAVADGHNNTNPATILIMPGSYAGDVTITRAGIHLFGLAPPAAKFVNIVNRPVRLTGAVVVALVGTGEVSIANLAIDGGVRCEGDQHQLVHLDGCVVVTSNDVAVAITNTDGSDSELTIRNCHLQSTSTAPGAGRALVSSGVRHRIAVMDTAMVVNTGTSEVVATINDDVVVFTRVTGGGGLEVFTSGLLLCYESSFATYTVPVLNVLGVPIDQAEVFFYGCTLTTFHTLMFDGTDAVITCSRCAFNGPALFATTLETLPERPGIVHTVTSILSGAGPFAIDNSSDTILVNPGGVTMSLVLPAVASVHTGTPLTIKSISDDAASLVTITVAGGGTIDGAANLTMSPGVGARPAITVQADITNTTWHVVARNFVPEVPEAAAPGNITATTPLALNGDNLAHSMGSDLTATVLEASAVQSGVVSTAAQTLAGPKTFADDATLAITKVLKTAAVSGTNQAANPLTLLAGLGTGTGAASYVSLQGTVATTTGAVAHTQAESFRAYGQHVQLNAGLAYSQPALKTGSYTIQVTDSCIGFNTNSGAWTATLPAANAVPNGWRIEVYDGTGNASNFNLTINRAGADLVEAGQWKVISASYGSMTLRSDGVSKWTQVSGTGGGSIKGHSSGIILINGNTGIYDFSQALTISAATATATASGIVNFSTQTFGGAKTILLDDAAISAVSTVLTINHAVTGTATYGLGTRMLFQGESTTGTTIDLGAITATHESSGTSVMYLETRNSSSVSPRISITGPGHFSPVSVNTIDLGDNTFRWRRIYCGTWLISPSVGPSTTQQHVLPAVTSDTVSLIAAAQTLTNKTLSTGTKASLGSDATGDVYYNGGSGTLTRLGIGTDGQVITAATGVPTWATPSGGTPTLLTSGVDASLPGTPGGVGQTYYATDTRKVYLAIDASTWRLVSYDRRRPVDADTIIAWGMQATSGTTIVNEGTAGVSGVGTLNAGATLMQDGMFGYGVGVFGATAGTRDALVSPGGSAVRPAGNAVTVSVWAKIGPAISASAALIMKPYRDDNTWNNPYISMTYEVNADGTFLAKIARAGAYTTLTALGSRRFPLNIWSLASWVYDGQILKIYLNQRLIMQNDFGSVASVDWGTEGPWAIGAIVPSASASQAIDAQYAEFRVEGVARSAAYIAETYERGMGWLNR